jgi:hypothetical protein
MLRRVVVVAVLVLVGLAAFTLLSPLAPDGSWFAEAGGKIANALRAFWGNPVAP